MGHPDFSLGWERQIPFRNDRKKGKSKGNRRSFGSAALRMTDVLGVRAAFRMTDVLRGESRAQGDRLVFGELAAGRAIN